MVEVNLNANFVSVPELVRSDIGLPLEEVTSLSTLLSRHTLSLLQPQAVLQRCAALRRYLSAAPNGIAYGTMQQRYAFTRMSRCGCEVLTGCAVLTYHRRQGGDSSASARIARRAVQQ